MKTTLRLMIAVLLFACLLSTSCQPTDYTADINALKVSRDSLAAALKVTNSNLQTTNNTIAGLSTSITTIQAQLAVISGQISTLNTQLTATNATVAGHTTAIATIQSQIKSIQDQIVVINSQQTATNSTVSGLSTTITSIQTQLNSVLSQIVTLNTQQTATSTSLSDISSKLTTSINQLNTLSLQFNALLIQLGLPAKDIDGNTYKTTIIGTQVWMAENLKTTKYSDGSNIPSITGATAWEAAITPAYSWENNDINTKNTYGALYNWYTVDSSSNGNKNVCPTGWHVPSDSEFYVLFNSLGGANVAGGKLKAIGTTFWNAPNGGATNESGFNAISIGEKGGGFASIGHNGYWWSTLGIGGNGYYLYLNSDNGIAGIFGNNKMVGFSIRCVKN